jgi:hypothetical protein
MNVLLKIFSLLPLIPGVVQGIEAIHGSAKSGAGKKQLAMESLGLASGVAGAVLPGDQAEISAVTNVVSSAIDSTVSLFNQFGWFHAQPANTVTPATT